MDELKLRGFVSPEDFKGTDTECIREAVRVSVEKHIGRVVICGKKTVTEPVCLWGDTEIVLENAELSASGNFPVFVSAGCMEPETRQWALQEEWLRITSENSTVNGDLFFENVSHLVLDKVHCTGTVTVEYVWDSQIFSLSAKDLVIARGCKNFILQNLDLSGSVLLSTASCKYGLVIAKEPEINNIIFQDSSVVEGIRLTATEEAKIFNIQIDGIESSTHAVTIGVAGVTLPERQYYNLTAVNLKSGEKEAILFNNPTYNCYFG